ncbi:MAG: ATP-binding cassette domain-containing protein [Spirochaetaceae bacterium]|nr:ATP-binding cassette domain-containing protein [Spirochaetaceae bacterium]
MANEEKIEKIVRVEHLRQYFDGGKFRAVDDISFDIKKGEVLGLVGESGCGKTTTGRSIIKLYDITGGNIYFKGIRINAGLRDYTDEMEKARKIAAAFIADAKQRGDKAGEENARRELKAKIATQKSLLKQALYDKKNCEKIWRERNGGKNERLMTKIQMIFQDPVTSLDPRMTVREIIAEGLRIQGVKDETAITDAVSDVLKTVGLVPEYADRYPHEFSGGQRQRIGIARAIVMKPELIIADEPVSALDVSIKAQVINLLNDLRKNMGLTILFIAHDLSVVKYFSDRIAVMYFGKIVELASSQELFSRPLHPYTKSLLSAIPLPDPHYEKRRVRIVYQPSIDHDYSEEKPTFREVFPGHFVSCNSAEEATYKAASQ